MATENAFLDKFGVTVLWNSLKNYINKVMPKKLSAFSNDEGYIKGISTLTFTGAQEATFDGKHNVTINIPNSSGEVTPGVTNYNDLTNKPSINGILLSGNKTLGNLGINIPTRVSQLSNDADYLTSSSLTGYVKRTDLTNVAFTGSYNSLTNKPTIPVLPSNVSAFYNDAGYLTTHQDISGKVDYSELNNRLSNIYTKAQVDALIDEIQTEGGGEVDLRNYYTKDAADGRFQPIGNYLTSHQDISGKANTADLKAVAFSGNYSDLTNKPTIPSSQNTKTINNESIYGTGNIDTKEILYYDLDVSAEEQEDSTYSIENTELYNIVKNNPNKQVVLRSIDEGAILSLRYVGYYLQNEEVLGYMFEGYFFTNIISATVTQANIILSITNLGKKEDTDNKVNSITDSHNTADYPTAIAVRNALSTKQNTLVSGETIKTINGNSILGSGNITINSGSGQGIKMYAVVEESGTYKILNSNGDDIVVFSTIQTNLFNMALVYNGTIYRLDSYSPVASNPLNVMSLRTANFINTEISIVSIDDDEFTSISQRSISVVYNEGYYTVAMQNNSINLTGNTVNQTLDITSAVQ